MADKSRFFGGVRAGIGGVRDDIAKYGHRFPHRLPRSNVRNRGVDPSQASDDPGGSKVRYNGHQDGAYLLRLVYASGEWSGRCIQYPTVSTDSRYPVDYRDYTDGGSNALRRSKIMSTSNDANVTAGETLAEATAGLAVAAGAPALVVPVVDAAAILATAIMAIANAGKAGALSISQVKAAWAAMGVNQDQAINAWIAAK